MKNIIFLLMVLCIIGFSACKDKKEDQKTSTHTEAKTPADSVMDQVMEGHDVGMAKMGRLDAMQKDVQRVLDSIGKLPGKARVKLEPLKLKMESVLEDLKSAKSGMEKWMEEFRMDSAENDVERRLRYLTDENSKITAVKKNILSSLQRADSLIKAKF